MLSAHGIHASYGQVPVLAGVEIDVGDREVLVLLGRNGVGKTTLMRVLIGLLKSIAGRTEFDGIEISGMPPHRIARLGIAYVPQGRGIFPKLTVRENLLVGTRAREGGNGEIPDEVFSHFPILGERLDQLGGTLSGGEQQMLAIGRALCGAPKLMLLDEPSEGIQPNIVHQLGDLIRDIVDRTGISVLLVEQNLDLALQLADRCLVMEKGRIVYEGAPDDFRDESVMRKYLAI